MMMGRFPYQGFMAIPSAQDKKIVRESMQLTDTEEFAERKMNTLSGESCKGFFLPAQLRRKRLFYYWMNPQRF